MASAPIGRNGVAPLDGARDRVGPHHLPVARDPGDRQADRLAGTGLDDHAADRYVRLEGGRDGDAAVGVGGDDRACVLVLCIIASLAEFFRSMEFSAAGPVQRLQRHVPPPGPIRAESHDADRHVALCGPVLGRAFRGRREGESCEFRDLVCAVVVMHHVGEGDPPAVIEGQGVLDPGADPPVVGGSGGLGAVLGELVCPHPDGGP